jgi:flagellum-specific peptidoglycan hydrolase FlgJ
MSKKSNSSLLIGAAAVAALAVYYSSTKGNGASSKTKYKGDASKAKFKGSSSDYIKTMYPYAKAVQDATTVPAAVNILISAVESGFGKHAPGNNYHGIKADKSWKGDKTMLKTPECIPTSDTSHLHATVLSVIPPNGSGAFQACSNKNYYTAWINDGFRAYPNAQGSFEDFANFLKTNSRYAPAFDHVNDPKAFGTFILSHGYSTAEYVPLFLKLLDQIEAQIKTL